MRGRLASAQSTPAGSTTPTVDSTYAFNGLNQKVQMSTLARVVSLAYDESGHLLGHYTASNGPETVWLGDMPIAVVKGSIAYYVHSDYHNTPRQIDNASKQAVWSWEPIAFGANAPNTDPLNTGSSFDYKLRFPGQFVDSEPGLRYNYLRDYDPAVGRYVEGDPIGLIGGINTYAYAMGNPVSHIDPLGLDDGICMFNSLMCTPSTPVSPLPATVFPPLPQTVVDAGEGFGQGVVTALTFDEVNLQETLELFDLPNGGANPSSATFQIANGLGAIDAAIASLGSGVTQAAQLNGASSLARSTLLTMQLLSGSADVSEGLLETPTLIQQLQAVGELAQDTLAERGIVVPRPTPNVIRLPPPQ